MRQGRIEADPGGHLIRESFGQIPEGILQGPLATAQEGELQRVAGVEQAPQRLDNQRRALLVGQARNVGEEREGGILWKAQFALEIYRKMETLKFLIQSTLSLTFLLADLSAWN